jgi:hypothetical protein
MTCTSVHPRKFALTGAAGPAMVNCRVEGTPITAMASNCGHRLRLEGISHRFGDFVAVRDINLDIAGGELVALPFGLRQVYPSAHRLRLHSPK